LCFAKTWPWCPRPMPAAPLVVRRRYLAIVPQADSHGDAHLRRRYLIVVPRPKLATPRRYLIVVLRPLPAAPPLCVAGT
jgi:hypothetical protein